MAVMATSVVNTEGSLCGFRTSSNVTKWRLESGQSIPIPDHGRRLIFRNGVDDSVLIIPCSRVRVDDSVLSAREMYVVET